MGNSERDVLDILKKISFPGIKLGQGNETVCNYFKSKNYSYTPDLVSGPTKIEQAPIEGLFFIDVNEPSGDILFKTKASHQLEKNISKTLKRLLQNPDRKEENLSINKMPSEHHKKYLDVLNKKLDKYAHQRKFHEGKKISVTSNLGIVHHFNLGVVKDNIISDRNKLITLVDYFRFYKLIALSENADLDKAEDIILKELINCKQEEPFIVTLGRNWSDLPALFLMIHILIKRNNKKYNLGLILVNTSILDKSNFDHPVHK